MNLEIDSVVLPLGALELRISLHFTGRCAGLFGRSGAGKTTLLEVIAGLRSPLEGRIAQNGRSLFDVASGVDLPPQLRRIGYVPQDDALFPHMNVRRNIAYGARTDAADVARLLEVEHLLERSVHRLSGGEKKRVALARAIATAPDLLLLDEPLAGVDLPLRERLLEQFLRIRDEQRIPIIYVTHQREELDTIAEEFAVLDAGEVLSVTRQTQNGGPKPAVR